MEAAQRQAFAAAGITPERESTEWDDQLRKHGIIPAVPPKPPGPEAPVYSVDNKEPEEIQDDDLIDEQEQQRLAEMKAEAAKKLVGTDEVKQITKAMWQNEVTNAGDTYVLVHLFQPGTVHEHHRVIARRHPSIKCVRIVATEAVPNYPARNIPTLLLYHRSDPVDQLVGPAAFANVSPDCTLFYSLRSLTRAAIEKFLIRKHALQGGQSLKNESDDKEDNSD